MKVFISVDIEGVNGNCHWDETEIGKPGYELFRQQMTAETVACCKALQGAGVSDIYVRDAHDSARNINPLDLPKGVKLIRGWTGSICDMMSYLDRSFDASIMLGYHSPSRSDGNPLSHTLNNSHHNILINNNMVSEFLLNAYYSQTLNVPVLLVSGDENLCELVKKTNKYIETVATKKGIHGAVVSDHPEVTCDQIYAATKLAIEKYRKDREVFNIVMPKTYDTEICFRHHADAYRASFYPGASLTNSDITTFKSDDYLDVLRFITFTVK